MTEKQRILLITGAAGGIGRSTVQVFSEHGWKVIGVDRQPRYEGFPENGLYIESDISLPEKLEEYISKCLLSRTPWML